MSRYYYIYIYIYNKLKCPSIDSIVNFIEKSNLTSLYKKWDDKISDLQVEKTEYFDIHNIFITPYLRTSEYINKLDNVKS